MTRCHTIVAFNKAIADYEKEGGLNARIDKYKKHYSVLYNGMIKMGFVPFLPVNMQGYFITSFLYPKENFNFTSFYNHLKDNGQLPYQKYDQKLCLGVPQILTRL